MKSSRRELLKTGAAALAGVCLARVALAQAKATKQAMQYQDHPKGDQQCDKCMQWIPGPNPGAKGSCKVVEGPIDPNGWCVAFVKKPAS